MALDGTYDGLLASVKDWLVKNNMDAIAPDLITLAEIKIEQTVRVRANEKRIDPDPTIDGDDNSVSIPADYAELKEVDNQSSSSLGITRISASEGMALGPFAVGPSPTVFWELLDKWYFWPVTNEHTLTLVYYFKPDRLSDSNQTNELFAAYPDLYLFGALAEAESWLKLPAAEREYTGKFNMALSGLINEKQQREYSGTPLRTSTPYF